MDKSDDLLWDLLAQWEEARNQGHEIPVEVLAQDHPELLEPLRQHIESLKRMDWLLQPAPTINGQEEEDFKPFIVGEYTVVGKIGAGGMGEVYRALHRRMDRYVALKLLPPNLHQEVRSAARLTHLNIVTAYDAGEYEGKPYLVMELVEGCDLQRHVQEKGPLPVKQAVDFIVQAARGLDYAHRRGIVHRDVKPANLILSGEGTVKVLDLGLALLPAGQQASGTAGTVDYLAPEQTGEASRADERSDVYSLGCTLYFLLTGKPIHEGKTALEKLLAHREKPAPSLRQTRPEVPPALDAVFQKMVAKRPEDRLQSMEEVLGALQTVHRAKTPFRAFWVLGAGLLLFSLTLLALYVRSLGNSDQPVQADHFHQTGRNFLPGDSNDSGKPAPPLDFEAQAGVAYSSLTVSRDGKHVLAGGFYGSLTLWDAATGKLFRTWKGHRTKIHGVAFRPDGTVAASGGGDDDSTVRLWDVSSGKQLRCLQGHHGGVWGVSFSPDGRLLLSGGHEGTVRLWDAENGQERHCLEGHQGPVFGVAYAPDGRHVVSCGDDKTVRLWDVTTGQQVRSFEGHTSPVWAVAISPDGKRLLSGDLASVACVWDVASGTLVHRLRSPTRAVFCVAFSPDSRYAVTGGGKAFLERDGWRDFTLCLWEVEKGLLRERYEGHTAVVWGVVFAPDGNHVLSCSHDGMVRSWAMPKRHDR